MKGRREVIGALKVLQQCQTTLAYKYFVCTRLRERDTHQHFIITNAVMRITNTLRDSSYFDVHTHLSGGEGEGEGDYVPLFVFSSKQEPKHLSEDLAQRFYPWLTVDRPSKHKHGPGMKPNMADFVFFFIFHFLLFDRFAYRSGFEIREWMMTYGRMISSDNSSIGTYRTAYHSPGC